MGEEPKSLTAEIVARGPLESAGNPGNLIERVALRDGREIVLKRVSLEQDRLDPRHDHTLIHGDLRLGNLGFSDGRVVVIDWGERAGSAPPAVEPAWFIGFDAYRFDASPDDVIAQLRARYADRSDEVALQLGLIGGLVRSR